MSALLVSFMAVASAYCCVGVGGGYCHATASGEQVAEGQLAADWSVLPVGSVWDVDGYGRARVTDNGSPRFIFGTRIDVFFQDCRRANAWGIRRVRVTRLDAAVAPAPGPVPAPVVVERAVYPEGQRWIEVTGWRDATGQEWDAFAEVAAP